jgi:hypothetical protein
MIFVGVILFFPVLVHVLYPDSIFSLLSYFEKTESAYDITLLSVCVCVCLSPYFCYATARSKYPYRF